MCVEFTNLNKACLKDHISFTEHRLPGRQRLRVLFVEFLDAFSGYNQIRMHPKDESKTNFMAEVANYCYKVMPFGGNLSKTHGSDPCTNARAQHPSICG